MKKNEINEAKSFSLIFGLGIIFLSLVFFIKSHFGIKYFVIKTFNVLPLWFKIIFLIGILIIITGKMFPEMYVSVSKAWLKFGEFLSGINIIILGFIYYCVVTPFAFMLKLFGKKLMITEFRTDTESYWEDRNKPYDPEQDFKQY